MVESVDKTTRYRLVCYEDYIEPLPPCVFDGGKGVKDCSEPLHVRVDWKPETVFGKKIEKPVAMIRIDKGKRQTIPLPYGHWPIRWKEKTYFTQPKPATQRPHRKKTKTSYRCDVSQIIEEDEAKLLKMKKSHPKIWGIMEPFLYCDTNFGLKDRTFGELAVDFMRGGWSQEEMLPVFLIEKGNQVCSRMYDFEGIPFFSSTAGAPQCVENAASSFEAKSCDPEWGGYDRYFNSDDMEKDRNCFFNTLAASVPQTPFAPDMDKDLSVLEIGCGAAAGAVSLAEFLRKYGKNDGICLSDRATREVNYTGVDLDEGSIAKAETDNPPEFKFFAQDAAQFLDERIGWNYDVILFRHPGPMLDGDFSVGFQDVWSSLMRKAYDHLSPDGLLIVSALTCEEYLFSQWLFEDEIGATIYATGRNPLYITSRDEFLLMVGKNPQEESLPNHFQ